jgi:DNA gyrase subunit A
MSRFKLSDLQTTAILDLQLRRLAALERQKIEDEYMMVKETIAYLEDLLSHPEKILKVAKDELAALKAKYGDERRTKVYKGKVGEFSEEDLIPNEPTVITLTNTGYIKRQSLSSFRTQHRGGKGVKGMTTKEEDGIMHIRYCMTHDNILFFTNKGKAYQLKAYEITESQRVSKGSAVVNLINIESGEVVESFVTYNKTDQWQNVFLTTKNGTVKKTKLEDFENIRRGGILAIKLEKGDQLQWSSLTAGDGDAIIFSRNGKSIRFSEKEVRPQGRNTMGVRGIKLTGDDQVVGMDIVKVKDTAHLITIMDKGYGKKTTVDQFGRQSRGGQGIKIAQVTEKTGKIAASTVVPEGFSEIIITSKRGLVVKLELASIPKLGRATQGVILMRFSNTSDSVASITCIE